VGRAGVFAIALEIMAACSSRGGGDAPRVGAADGPTPTRRLTPGACGYWETTIPESLATCQRRLLSSSGVGAAMLPGRCGSWQIHGLDSLKACLARLDVAARACPPVDAWILRMTGGVARRAEWRRCGPAEPEWQGDSAVYPTDYLLVRGDTAALDSLIWGDTNDEEAGLSGLDGVRAVDLDGDSSDELFFVTHVYGTGAIFEPCALTDDGGRLRCWSGPDFRGSDRALRPGETTRKGWIPVAGPGRPPASPKELTLGGGRSLWYFTPVYADSDPNCCGSVGASLWLEARPNKGEFVTTTLLRGSEDSLGRVVAFDTIPLR
jgi:hypothetical protein